MNGFPEALKQACAIAGLDAEGTRLLRLGSNAVYRLADPVVARISRPGTEIGPVRRTVAVARWLESVDYPAVRLVDVDQPILADGYVVTFWSRHSGLSAEDLATAGLCRLRLRSGCDRGVRVRAYRGAGMMAGRDRCRP
jgi:hypothetical protein